MMSTGRYILHYFVLIVMLTLSAWMFFLSQGNHGFQLVIGVTTACLYATWGVAHHSIIGDLHRKVVVEYILIGAIAIALFVIVLRS
ncbi:hypothetical protein HY947_02990 [Candidatus Gottesmanbacteria bacterium]|nr:hypothetical protein [Candidatus Gottesmanbacteria bacterium]